MPAPRALRLLRGSLPNHHFFKGDCPSIKSSSFYLAYGTENITEYTWFMNDLGIFKQYLFDIIFGNIDIYHTWMVDQQNDTLVKCGVYPWPNRSGVGLKSSVHKVLSLNNMWHWWCLGLIRCFWFSYFVLCSFLVWFDDGCFRDVFVQENRPRKQTVAV